MKAQIQAVLHGPQYSGVSTIPEPWFLLPIPARGEPDAQVSIAISLPRLFTCHRAQEGLQGADVPPKDEVALGTGYEDRED